MQIDKIYQLYQQYSKISTDTRSDVSDSIFFALKGDNFDGNKYARTALSKGAKYAIISDPILRGNKDCIFVKDVLKTLQKLSTYHRNQLDIPIIAITGSNGKTTTKELIYRILERKYNCFATPGNFNNLIGVPLSLLKINSNHEIAVIELGANHKKENEILTNICQPNFGLTTNIGKDHLGEFGGMDNVIEAYKEFIDYFQMKESPYVFFLNHDDYNLIKLTVELNKISFGQSSNLKYSSKFNCCGEIIEDGLMLEAKIRSTLKNYTKEEFIIKSKLFGSFNLSNILAAVCIGQYFKVSNEEIKNAIENYIPANNRSQIIQWKSNLIILDAYNANPTSMVLVTEDFARLQAKNKIIILGNMNELGEYSFDEHKKIVNLLKTLNFTQIILTGVEFGKLSKDIDCLYFEDVFGLKVWLKVQNFKDTFFLVKGSRGEQLEKAFEGII